MKDGWTYGVEAGTGIPGASRRLRLWQFPATGFPFYPGRRNDPWRISRYLMPGAAWNDVFITMTGGEEVTNCPGTWV